MNPDVYRRGHVVGEEISATSSVTREFNLVFGATLAVSLVFLFVSAVFGDAFVNIVVDNERENDVHPVERYKLPYQTNGDFGVALEVGPYDLLPTEMNGILRITSLNTRCRSKRAVRHQTASSARSYGAKCS